MHPYCILDPLNLSSASSSTLIAPSFHLEQGASTSRPPSISSPLGLDTDEVLVDSPITPVKPLLQLSDENYKKQRRRECHNLVEKRRREHINAKIEELGTLLPEKYNQIDEPAEEEDEDGKTTAKKKVSYIDP